MTLSFVADAAWWPDAEKLTDAMRSSWLELRQLLLPELIGALSA